jgi:hypothetical protein
MCPAAAEAVLAAATAALVPTAGRVPQVLVLPSSNFLLRH